MLNEEKIRLMTDIAVFEKKNGSRMERITGYFKSDYISRNLIRGFLSYTVCSVLIMILWIFYYMDVFVNTAGIDTLTGIAGRMAVIYLIGLALYLIVVYAVYAKRYDDELRKNRIYTAKLKHLDKRYDFQNRSRELAREGRRL